MLLLFTPTKLDQGISFSTLSDVKNKVNEENLIIFPPGNEMSTPKLGSEKEQLERSSKLDSEYTGSFL